MIMSLGIQNNYYSESSMVSAIRKQEAGNVTGSNRDTNG